MGPFNGSNTDYQLKRGIYTGRLIVEESSGRVLEAIANCGVLSRNQAALITDCKNAPKTIGRLASKGYLDEYISKTSPPLYSLGKKGAEILGVAYKTWDTIPLLRLAAANQLWSQIRKMWPGAVWNTAGGCPVVTASGVSFVIAAPRLIPRENFYAILTYNHIGANRLLVVAASQEQTEELSTSIANKDIVRYTWDDLLKDGATFYYSSGKKLVKDKGLNSERNFKKSYLKPIDGNLAVIYN